MRSTVENLKGVLEAIRGEHFLVVAEKMADLDAARSGHIQMLSGMLSAESGVIRAESVRRGQALRSQSHALQAAFNRIQSVKEALRSGVGSGQGGRSSKPLVRIPNPCTQTTDMLTFQCVDPKCPSSVN